jgi:hypothetical protein
MHEATCPIPRATHVNHVLPASLHLGQPEAGLGSLVVTRVVHDPEQGALPGARPWGLGGWVQGTSGGVWSRDSRRRCGISCLTGHGCWDFRPNRKNE